MADTLPTYSDIISDEMKDKYNDVKLNSDWIIDTNWKGTEVKEKIEKQANNVKTLFIAVMLFGAGGLQKANADTLSFNTTRKSGANVGVIVPNIDYKNYDDNIFEKVVKACDTAIFVGDNNIKNETSDEVLCADNGGDAYGVEYDRRKDKIAEKQNKIAENLRKDTANNYKTADKLDNEADDLRKDTANKKIIIKKIDKYL